MDTKEITLPVSEQKVEIRNYLTKKDEMKAEAILYSGVAANSDTSGAQGNISFPLANVMASDDVYVRRLVQSIGGDNSNIAERLEDMNLKDYEAIKKVVDEIVNEYSPKAKEAKKASKNATT